MTLQETAVLFKMTKDISSSRDINQDYLEDNIPPINPAKIKNIVDFCQGDIPKQKPMKIDNDTKDLDRFNRQQITDDNSNNQFEKRNGDTFIPSCRMNLFRTAEFIASANWDEIPLPKGDWEGSNDHDYKSFRYLLEG